MYMAASRHCPFGVGSGPLKAPFDSHNNLHRESYRLIQVQASAGSTGAQEQGPQRPLTTPITTRPDSPSSIGGPTQL